MAATATLSEQYAQFMKLHPQGLAIYEPVSNTQLSAGSCGYFSDSGTWVTIAQLDDKDQLKSAGFTTPAALVSVPDKVDRSWHPKCSLGVSGMELDISGGIP